MCKSEHKNVVEVWEKRKIALCELGIGTWIDEFLDGHWYFARKHEIIEVFPRCR